MYSKSYGRGNYSDNHDMIYDLVYDMSDDEPLAMELANALEEANNGEHVEETKFGIYCAKNDEALYDEFGIEF
ncbi:MAG: hypothetical protein FWG94_08185 [Oscillospiraceae bacterium]|nr:hypothetical protein [Oscillospiraceae bacterium]